MIKLYDIPKGKRIAECISMYVNDKRAGVFATEVNNTHVWKQDFSWTLSFAAVGIIDFDENVKLRIHTEFKTETVTVRPLAKDIKPEIIQCEDGSSDIIFELSCNENDKNSYDQYSIEFNDDRNNTMHLFAGKIEDYSSADIVIKSGEAYYGNINLEKGQTLCIEGGAVVYGRIYFADDTKLCGRGIVDGSDHANWAWNIKRAYNPIVVSECNNVRIEGISILNPPCWVCGIASSSNVYLNNVKIISAKANSDGISIQSSNHVYVDNCFIRSWDDSIVVKSYKYNINAHDIYVNNCQIWTDLAQCMEIGFETNKGESDKPEMYNIEFKDVTVLHQLHKGAISIHNADNTEIHDVLWENITIEEIDAPDHEDGWNIWLDFTNVAAKDFKIPGSTPSWTTVEERGTIHDITIRNVNVIKDVSGSSYRIWPVNEGVDIYNLAFENAYNYGKVEPYEIRR